MNTSYNIVENSFLNKISDDYLAELSETDLKNIIDKYMISAIPKFKQCNKLLDRDNVLRQFNQSLTEEEIEILANLMVLEWLKPKINSIELLKQSISTKDYKIYSDSAKLQSLIKLKDSIKTEVGKMITSYTYSKNNLDDLIKKVYDYD